MQRFDVIVVGGRVAGTAAAVRFARAGLSVLVLERGTRHTEVPSTHTIQNVAGLVDLVRASRLDAVSAPRLVGSTLWVDDLDLSARHEDHPWISVRRIVLDELLRDAAIEAGACLRFGHRVLDLLSEGGRVTGVRYRTGDGQVGEATAALVVGADGRSSTVARQAGARRYNLTWNERGAAWCYLRGVDAPPEFYSHRFDDLMLLAAPCEHGLVMLAVQPVLARTAEYRGAGLVEEAFRRYGRRWGDDGLDWTRRLAGAERDGDTRMVLRYPCFFREGAGPGWALLGDAGHVKDVITGQGISDAIAQADRLVTHVLAGWGHPRAMDAATRAFWRARDRNAAAMYWLSQDMGRAGPVPPLYRGFFERIAGSGRLRTQLHEVLDRRREVRRLTSGRQITLAVARSLRQPGVDRRALARDLRTSAARELRRRRLALRPVYDTGPEPERGPGEPVRPGPVLAASVGGPAGVPGGFPLTETKES